MRTFLRVNLGQLTCDALAGDFVCHGRHFWSPNHFRRTNQLIRISSIPPPLFPAYSSKV
jgi:hypothetical protein